jgi:hypothetical protein
MSEAPGIEKCIHNTVRAELVEALPFIGAVMPRKGQSFDKLRTNGEV